MIDNTLTVIYINPQNSKFQTHYDGLQETSTIHICQL